MGFLGGCADHGPLCIAVLLGCGRVPGRVPGEMHFSGWRRVTTVIFPYERSSQHFPFSNGGVVWLPVGVRAMDHFALPCRWMWKGTSDYSSC